jgi:hypothetical protein
VKALEKGRKQTKIAVATAVLFILKEANKKKEKENPFGGLLSLYQLIKTWFFISFRFIAS